MTAVSPYSIHVSCPCFIVPQICKETKTSPPCYATSMSFHKQKLYVPLNLKRSVEQP